MKNESRKACIAQCARRRKHCRFIIMQGRKKILQRRGAFSSMIHGLCLVHTREGKNGRAAHCTVRTFQIHFFTIIIIINPSTWVSKRAKMRSSFFAPWNIFSSRSSQVWIEENLFLALHCSNWIVPCRFDYKSFACLEVFFVTLSDQAEETWIKRRFTACCYSSTKHILDSLKMHPCLTLKLHLAKSKFKLTFLHLYKSFVEITLILWLRIFPIKQW